MTLPAAAHAEGEFGIWAGATVEKKLPKKWGKHADDFSVNGGVSYRLGENLKQSTRIDASLGVDYKINKKFKVGVGYIYIHDYKFAKQKDFKYDDDGTLVKYEEDKGYWRNRHRGLFEATGKHKVGRFTFSLRERYQFTYFCPTETERWDYRWDDADGDGKEEWSGEFDKMDAKKKKHDHVLRSRLKVEYDIKGLPLAPFVSYEVTNGLRDKMRLEKHRVMAGADWKVTKKHKLSFAYLLNAPTGDNVKEHVIDISYKFDF